MLIVHLGSARGKTKLPSWIQEWQSWLRKMGLTRHTCGSTGVWRTGRGREKVEIYKWLTLGWFGSSICVLVEVFQPKSNKSKETESSNRLDLYVHRGKKNKHKKYQVSYLRSNPFSPRSILCDSTARKERQIVWFLHMHPNPLLSKQTVQEWTWSYAAQTSRFHPTMGSGTAVEARRS